VWHAEAIAAISNICSELFPEGSGAGNTRAKSAIWEKPDEFRQACTDGAVAADGLLSAVKSGKPGSVKKEFRRLSKSCSRCHRKFREPR
ncbi:MAG: cytochrome c, partial [Gammaproteobacteria bacterium]|nr:cytochrome c [Gammaproteobacteria bacterium]